MKMVVKEAFLTFAMRNNLDTTYNTGSRYFNSKETRIAYFKFMGEIT